MNMDWGAYDDEGAVRQRFLDIDDRTEDVKECIERLPGGAEEFNEIYDISWIHHEAGLEGIVLTYPEIKSAVDSKIVSDVSLLPTYQEVKNTKWCIDLIREKATTKRFAVTVPFLKEMHGRLVDDPEMEGVYRKDIPIHRTYFHEIEQPAKIHQSLEDCLEYLKGKDSDLHPVEFAANVHHRFMRVFPFSKFSGFLGRLMLNYVLIKNDYLPVVIHQTDRQRYYDALRGAESEFREFLASSIENSLENSYRYLVAQHRESLRRRVMADAG